jgi:hypothetical protein
MNNFWSRSRLGRTLLVLACLFALIVFLYAEEDLRGWYAWHQFKRHWEAKDEKFDFKAFVPPPVPDDQNFALTPIVYSSYGNTLTRDGKEIPASKRDEELVNRLQMQVVRGSDDWPGSGRGNWELATLTDLKPWQAYYRNLAAKTNLFPVAAGSQTPAQDVLLALSKYDSTIEELRAASKLPYSRFPINYNKDDSAAILLPHLAVMKNCIQILGFRAIAELQNGQTEKALDDVKLMLYLNNSIRGEPFLISHLVRIAMFALTLQPIYEGLAEQKWSDAQLAELNEALGSLDFLADYKFSMRGELILGIHETDYLRRSRNFSALDYSGSGNHQSPFSQLGFRLAPASFFYRNEMAIARAHLNWTIPMVDVEKRIVTPTLVRRDQAAGDKALKQGLPYYNVLARMLFPAVSAAVKRFARAQSSIDLARVAIALERYRLAHGQFPETLDALAPQFLETVPHDIINGEPLHYRREAYGQFVLYSVGWNEKDDDGVSGAGKSGKMIDYDKGDLVWHYPQK